MKPFYVSKKRVGLRRLGKKNCLFNADLTVEMTTGNLRCITFDKGIDSKLLNWPKKDFITDMLPVTFPQGMRMVMNPLGGTRKNYDATGDEFKPIVSNAGDEEPTNVFLLDGTRRPSEDSEDDDQAEINRASFVDICAIYLDEYSLAGAGCSVPAGRYYTDTHDPLTFYIKAEGLRGNGEWPMEPGEDVPDTLDHFLLLHKLPNNTCAWLAFPRDESPEVNKRTLSKWKSDTFDFASFNGELVFFDDMGLLVAFGAEPVKDGKLVVG